MGQFAPLGSSWIWAIHSATKLHHIRMAQSPVTIVLSLSSCHNCPLIHSSSKQPWEVGSAHLPLPQFTLSDVTEPWFSGSSALRILSALRLAQNLVSNGYKALSQLIDFREPAGTIPVKWVSESARALMLKHNYRVDKRAITYRTAQMLVQLALEKEHVASSSLLPLALQETVKDTQNWLCRQGLQTGVLKAKASS